MPHSGKALVDPYIVFRKVMLGQGMRVADLGCGRTGHFVFPASRVVGENGIVYAVEIVPETLQSIKSRVRTEGYDNVRTVWADIEQVGKTPIPDGSVDVCFMVNVLFMVKERTQAITEAVRLLKPDGFLAIIEWSRPLGAIGPSQSQMIDPRMLTTWSQSVPVTAVDNFAVGEYHYCALFKKNI